MSSNTTPLIPIPTYGWDLITKIAKQEGFGVYSIAMEGGSDRGDGFQGVMVRIVIKGQRKIDETLSDDQLALICKFVPIDVVRREMFGTSLTFEREIYSYEHLLPALVKYQEDKGITAEDGFFQFPKCYGTFSDALNGEYALAMEDLKVAGYEVWNKSNPLDFEHAQLALAQLGRYHALSFGLRDQCPEVFKRFDVLQADVLRTLLGKDASFPFWENNFEMAANALEHDETDLIQQMKYLKSNYLQILNSCTADNAAEPFTVIGHGDLWINNMMYRYSAGSRVPQAVCLIDWQVAQKCSPAIDFSYFIYSSTEQNLWDEHYDDLLHVYYDSCAEMINRLGSDSEKLFKFSDFQDQLKRFSAYGLIAAPLFAQLTSVDAKELPDMDEVAHAMGPEKGTSEFQGFVKAENPAFRKRISNVIRHHFGRNCIL